MALTKANNRMIDGAVYNVLDYGADPTGVADSAAAFQAAIDAAVANAETIFSWSSSSIPLVRIPAGKYTISTAMVVKSSVSIVGDGMSSTYITATGTAIDGSANSVSNDTSFGHVISGMTLYGDGTGSGILATGWIRNCRISDMFIQGFNYNINLTSSWTIFIENCFLNGAADSNIKLDQVGQSNIDNCRIDDAINYGIQIDNTESISITNSSIQRGRVHGILANPSAGGEAILNINNCFFERNGENSVNDGNDVRSTFDHTTLVGCFSTQPQGTGTTAFASTKNMTAINNTTRYGSGRVGFKCSDKLVAIGNKSDSTTFVDGIVAGGFRASNSGDFGGDDDNVYNVGPAIIGSTAFFDGVTNKYRTESFINRQQYADNTTVTLRIAINAGSNTEPLCAFKLSVIAAHPIFPSTPITSEYVCVMESDTPDVTFVKHAGDTLTFDKTNVTASGGSFDVTFTMPNVIPATSVDGHVLVKLDGSGWESLTFI